jgi:hypothetical protein
MVAPTYAMIWPIIIGMLRAAVQDAERRINRRIGRWLSPRRYE